MTPIQSGETITTPNQAGETITVECYVRAAPAATVSDPLDRLRAYEGGEVVDSLAVETWPEEVSLPSAGESEAVTQYRRFEAWADREGVSLRPAFSVRERTTPVSDGSERVLTLPTLCLAVSVDGDLDAVVPHRSGTTTHTVGDVVAALERRARSSRDLSHRTV